MYLKLIFTIILLLSNCSKIIYPVFNDNVSSIKQIAYKNDINDYYTVYINQNDENVPYIVLSSNYDNKCILLRKYLLNENIIFNPPENRTSFYENSYIDNYLNNEFFMTYSDKLQNLIPETQITITSKTSIGICGTETIDIKRKIFLLSYTEITGDKKSSVILTEGNHLKYFNNLESRIALHESLEPDNWWLRTPITWDSIFVCVIGHNGGNGEIGINNFDGSTKTNGIRPAFCLPTNTPVTIGEIDGEKAYFIADE